MLKELNLSLLLRYGYSGFLLVGILLFTKPSAIKTVTDNAGAVLSPLLVLAVGACIYVVYRYLLGEWVLFPLMHRWDRFTTRTPASAALSPVWHLARLGVGESELRTAYTAVRRELLKDEVREQLDFAHTEIHILYITCIELIPLSIFLASIGAYGRGFLTLGLGLFVLFAAVTADTQQHRSELRTISSTFTEEQIKQFLRVRGFLQ
jgi:hypothetical protein